MTALGNLIVERLAALDPVHVSLEDDSAAHAGHAGAAGGAGHFSVTVVDLIPHQVHALAIRAYTPDEYFSCHERTVR